ncbi:MAG: ABC transporter permease [Phocaeicola sp.]
MLAFDLDEEYKAFMVLPRGLVDHVIEQTPRCGSAEALLCPELASMFFFTLDPEKPGFISKEEPYGIYKSFVQTVGMEFVAGSADGMDAPDGMLIPESKAKKLFPDGNAVGSYLYRKGKSVLIDEDQVRFRICGVYKDFPENSQFAANPLLVRMND